MGMATRFKQIARGILARPAVSRLVTGGLYPVRRVVPQRIWLHTPIVRPVRARLAGNDVDFTMDGRDDVSAAIVYWHGLQRWDPALLPVLLKLLEKDPRVVLDVGAFTGVIALTAATANARSQVFAFEAIPTTYERLAANAARNELANLTTVASAVSDRTGELEIFVAPDVALSLTNSSIEGLNGSTEALRVACTTLDDFAASEGLEGIDLIKIDVEGAEYDVFVGAAAIIARDRPVILCEVLFGTGDPRFGELVRSQGYRWFLMTDDGPVATETMEGDPTYKDLNFLLLPEEKVADLRSTLGIHGA